MTKSTSQQELIRLLNSKDAVIGVVGLGYIGLPLALCFVESGYRVLGFDINSARVDLINQGECPITHFGKRQVSMA